MVDFKNNFEGNTEDLKKLRELQHKEAVEDYLLPIYDYIYSQKNPSSIKISKNAKLADGTFLSNSDIHNFERRYGYNRKITG